MFPVAKSLSTSLLCILTDGIMCSIMPALSFSLALFHLICVCERKFLSEIFWKRSPHMRSHSWITLLCFFKVLLPAIRCLSSPSKQHVCVLTPSITLPMLWNMITNTETLLTLSVIFCSSCSFPLILSVRSSLLLFWEERDVLKWKSSAHPQASGPR